MAKPEKEAEDCASGGRSKEKPARLRHGGETHGQEAQNYEEADRMGRPLAGTIGAERHEMLWLGTGRVLGRFDHQVDCRPISEVRLRQLGKRKGPAESVPGRW